MNAKDISKYHWLVEKAVSLGYDVKVKGDFIELAIQDITQKHLLYERLGYFETVQDCFQFLCGYEYGVQVGRRLSERDLRRKEEF